MSIEKEVHIKKIAAMLAIGASTTDIAKEMKLTVQKVRYLANLPETKNEVDSLLEKALGDTVKQAKKQLANLLPKAIRALDKRLSEDADLKAAEMVLKGIGAMKEEDTPDHATAIQIVMPGGETKEIIEVKDEE